MTLRLRVSTVSRVSPAASGIPADLVYGLKKDAVRSGRVVLSGAPGAKQCLLLLPRSLAAGAINAPHADDSRLYIDQPTLTWHLPVLAPPLQPVITLDCGLDNHTRSATPAVSHPPPLEQLSTHHPMPTTQHTFPVIVKTTFYRPSLTMASSKRLFEGLNFFLQYSDRPKETFFSDLRLIRVGLPPSRERLLMVGRRTMVAQLASPSTRSLHTSWWTSQASSGFTPILYQPTRLHQTNRQ